MPVALFSSVADAEPEKLFIGMLPWLGAFLVLVILGGGFAIWLRRRYNHSKMSSSSTFSLHELRRMESEGKLSPEEFSKAKDAIVKGIRSKDASEEDLET